MSINADEAAVLDAIAHSLGNDSLWRNEAVAILGVLRDFDRAMLLRVLYGGADPVE